MLPAIYPAHFATRDELMRAVRAAIADALPEEMKPLS
jgi:1-acyl-sn-glycerol-3-phosphate acyltransferase